MTAQPDRRLRQAIQSVGGQPKLRTLVESFYKLRRELPPLFERHWREIALDQEQVPLAPDWDRYLAYTATKVLHVTTARAPSGALVGYIFNLVGPHLHYVDTKHAEIEMFWLAPEYRGGWFPIRWMRKNEKYLKSLGVKRVLVSVKIHFKDARVGKLFERLGYKPAEIVYGKVL